MEKRMHIMLKEAINYTELTDACIGIEYRYTNHRYHVYRVIDEHLFFLSVIKYGIEFENIQ